MTVDLALQLLISLLANVGTISELIQKAQAAGTDISIDDLATVFDNDSLARAKFVVAIAAAKSAGKPK